MSSESSTTENTRRLRALVRAIISPAVWLLAIWQAGIAVSMSIMAETAKAGETASPVFPAMLGLQVMGLAFLFGGTMKGFVISSGVVTIPLALREGARAFIELIWLLVRFFVVAAVLLQLLMYAFGISGEQLLGDGGRGFALMTAGLTLIFIYWLPLAFTLGDFRLFATLNLALNVAWHRLRQLPFLAILVLVPALLSLALPQDSPLWVILPLGVVGELASWAAYAYCIEYIQREKERLSAQLKTPGKTPL